MIRIGRHIRYWRGLAQTDVGRLGATLTEQLHGFTTIKGYKAETFEHQRFADVNARVRRQILQSEAWFGLLTSTMFLLTGMGMLAVLAYATGLRGQGSDYSTLLAFCLYGGQLIQPLRRFGEVQGLTQQMAVSAARVFAIIDQPLPVVRGEYRLVQPVRGRIVFDRIAFAYDAETLVLNEFTLSIEPGERIGLVGATGSGKSTVANLLLRHIHPTAGTITLDDQVLADVRLDDLRGAIAVVEQEPFLFNGSVLDNIRYGTWNASGDAVDRGVRMSGLDGLISRLRLGLHTSVAEAGSQLSGGEKQRIALARAIDSELEAEMFAQLDDWLAERTVIVIAHRYSTVRRCPRIAILEGGRVLDDGSATQLVRNCPRFVAMFADQLPPDALPANPDLVGVSRNSSA